MSLRPAVSRNCCQTACGAGTKTCGQISAAATAHQAATSSTTAPSRSRMVRARRAVAGEWSDT
ncbi:hypothetical protein ACFQY4_17255 [Catellatospora bangladeshensis]|uniref:hypothetical protein n=1 Tax=Catellatospora bangladeshensis TaxID=310355 RepID=UPI00361782CC